MVLDRAPIAFRKLVFFSTPNIHCTCVYNIVYLHVHNPYDPNLYDTFPQMNGTCTHHWILGWSSIVPQLAANYCSPRSLL